jgi:hypothetical protein
VSDYQRDQVQDVLRGGPAPGDDFFRMKVSGLEQSNWFNLTREQLEQIQRIVTGTPPKLEILTVRDPDSATDVYMWVDGEQSVHYESDDVDPGAGHQIEDWLGEQVQVLMSGHSESFKTAALEAYQRYDDSSWVEGDREEAEFPCHEGTGDWPNRKFCGWSIPIGDDLQAVADAAKQHKQDAHPEK